MPFPELELAIERALEIGKKNNVAIGIGSGTPEELRGRLNQGFRFPVYGTDYLMLSSAARQGISEFRK